MSENEAGIENTSIRETRQGNAKIQFREMLATLVGKDPDSVFLQPNTSPRIMVGVYQPNNFATNNYNLSIESFRTTHELAELARTHILITNERIGTEESGDIRADLLNRVEVLRADLQALNRRINDPEELTVVLVDRTAEHRRAEDFQINEIIVWAQMAAGSNNAFLVISPITEDSFDPETRTLIMRLRFQDQTPGIKDEVRPLEPTPGDMQPIPA